MTQAPQRLRGFFYPGWSLFLALVFLVRLGHLIALGPEGYVPGNNSRAALEAKLLLLHGLGDASVSIPPAPALLLALLGWLGDVAPGKVLSVAILGGHLLLALAFWFWVRSLKLPDLVSAISLWIFLWLPITNSYEAFDNVVVVWAAAWFLILVTSFRRASGATLERRGAARSLILLGLSSWALMLFRAEYLVLVPLFLLLWFAGRWGLARVRPARRELVLCGIVLMGLVAGALSTMTFRYYDSGEFSLGRRGYLAFTFLDGTPSYWLKPEDVADVDRVRRGIEYFGNPSEHDYSLVQIIRANPGRTVLKCLLNVPRWLYQLGRRHVVVPLPITLLMLAGIVQAWRTRRRADSGEPLAVLAATILMTLPLTLLIVYAEYLYPAFAAVAVLAAWGLASVGDWFRTRAAMLLSPDRERLWWTVLIGGTCVLMELLLLRGGGLLPDAVSLWPVAEQLDERFGESSPALLLDPYRIEIDCLSKADIRNLWLENRRSQDPPAVPELRDGFPRSLTPLEAARSPIVQAIGLQYVVIWRTTTDTTRPFEQDLKRWQAAGFEVVQDSIRPADAGQLIELLILRKRDNFQPDDPDASSS